MKKKVVKKSRKVVAKKETVKFRIGQLVKYKILTRDGYSTGSGRVRKLPPPNPGPGETRLHIELPGGSYIKPYVSQCSPK